MKTVMDVLFLFAKSFLGFFLILLVTPLAIKFTLENPRDPYSWQFYAAISFGLPFIAATAMIIYYIRVTAHRKRDPYRFSERQFRFFKVASTSRRDILEALQKMGYTCVQGTAEDNKIEVHATRKLTQLPKDFVREGGNASDPRPEQTLIIRCEQIEDIFQVSAECFTTKRFLVGDYSQTTYYSLEELIDAFSWEGCLVDKEGIPIIRNWERRN